MVSVDPGAFTYTVADLLCARTAHVAMYVAASRRIDRPATWTVRLSLDPEGESPPTAGRAGGRIFTTIHGALAVRDHDGVIVDVDTAGCTFCDARTYI